LWSMSAIDRLALKMVDLMAMAVLPAGSPFENYQKQELPAPIKIGFGSSLMLRCLSIKR